MCQALVFFFLAGNSIGTVLTTYVTYVFRSYTWRSICIYYVSTNIISLLSSSITKIAIQKWWCLHHADY